MSFARLDDELARWADAGRVATFWWRDDDAVAATRALARLAALARAHDVPVVLAVVPAALESSLGEAVERLSQCTVVQHGYAHANHAPSGAKSCELGSGRPRAIVARELDAGRERLAATFGDRFLPVLVPPWNRIDEALVAGLPSLGYVGLSTFAPRRARRSAPGLVRCNAHVDPIAWREGRRFAGTERALDAVVRHLAQRREGTVDADEPTGLLTHHLVFDEDAWHFADALLGRTHGHAAARWLGAAQAFAG